MDDAQTENAIQQAYEDAEETRQELLRLLDRRLYSENDRIGVVNLIEMLIDARVRYLLARRDAGLPLEDY